MRHLTMTTLILALGLFLASPSSAGPILESATALSATVELAQNAPSEPRYRKGRGRKWLELIGIVGGAVMTATTKEACFGQSCNTEWAKGVGSVGLTLATVSAISMALPDPD